MVRVDTPRPRAHFFLAKIDNDTIGYRRTGLARSPAVMDRHPELHFLGIEALYPAVAGPPR